MHTFKAVSSAIAASDLVARFLGLAGHHRYRRSHGQSCAMSNFAQITGPEYPMQTDDMTKKI